MPFDGESDIKLPNFPGGSIGKTQCTVRVMVGRQTESPHQFTNRRKAVPVGGDRA
jgi:hypothetical protein